MPKPILNTGQVVTQTISLHPDVSAKTKLNPLLLEKRLREKRSGTYMEIMKQLDVAGYYMDKSRLQEFINAINNEFPDIEMDNQLLGIVAKCYLGQPYEVHSLDLAGNIVVHYKVSENMPGLLNRARSLALHDGYEFIEVYIDCLRAVKADGSVTVAK